jgi:hypothetical protein
LDTITLGRPDQSFNAEHRLIDRTTGRTQSIPMPADKIWALMSVSPWRDEHGVANVVGRWSSRGAGQEESFGLGLVEMPSGKLANYLELDVLPTGKACWVPGRTGEILFPGGDGQLYRCNILSDSPDGAKKRRRGAPRGIAGCPVVPRAVVWEIESPGLGNPYLGDPAWSTDPRFQNLVFVALSQQKNLGEKRINGLFKIWWLLMNDDGDAIIAAGRLTRPVCDEANDDMRSERMPTVVVGGDGRLSVLYLTREQPSRSWQLRQSRLELDTTGAPSQKNDDTDLDRVIAAGLAVSPLVVSADARIVHAVDITGAHGQHAIAH